MSPSACAGVGGVLLVPVVTASTVIPLQAVSAAQAERLPQMSHMAPKLVWL